jgi:hypothetical protein
MSLITSCHQLSLRTVNVLKCECITTYQQLDGMGDKDLLRIPNLGKTALLEIRLAQVAQKLAALQGPAIDDPDGEENLRDMFAAYAMQPLLLAYDREIREGGAGFDVCPRAYRIADSMLKARKS